MKKQIIAMGGGGFARSQDYRSETLLLERYFCDATALKNPRVCFIPTASGESLEYVVNFYRAFSALSCKCTHLSLFELPTKDLESFLLNQDAIYVGGGNTKSMLALWKEWNLDQILKKAWNQGIVLGGISAGALCWFEEGITDSIPGPLTSLKCLGFLKGSHCPHYDSEILRRPAYQTFIQMGMKPGIAADDHVALHYIDDELANVVRASPTGGAYKVHFSGERILEKKIEPKNL